MARSVHRQMVPVTRQAKPVWSIINFISPFSSLQGVSLLIPGDRDSVQAPRIVGGGVKIKLDVGGDCRPSWWQECHKQRAALHPSI